MHEILFRGKRADNGEWAYGSLLVLKDDGINKYFIVRDYYDITEMFEFCGDIYEPQTSFLKGFYEINQETIGQYIGIKDKASKKIFEGDKVKQSFFGDEIIGVVVYDPNEAKFGVYEQEEDYYTEIVKDNIEIINE